MASYYEQVENEKSEIDDCIAMLNEYQEKMYIQYETLIKSFLTMKPESQKHLMESIETLKTSSEEYLERFNKSIARLSLNVSVLAFMAALFGGQK